MVLPPPHPSTLLHIKTTPKKEKKMCWSSHTPWCDCPVTAIWCPVHDIPSLLHLNPLPHHCPSATINSALPSSTSSQTLLWCLQSSWSRSSSPTFPGSLWDRQRYKALRATSDPAHRARGQAAICPLQRNISQKGLCKQKQTNPQKL